MMDIPPGLFGERLIAVPLTNKPGIHRPVLDWPGLTARLVAAHLARQILTPAPRADDGVSSSFAPGIAQALTGWRMATSGPPALASSPGINLTAKADGKLPQSISPDHAGINRRIVRGL